MQPRWTLQILGEMWGGSSRFSDIRRGVGNISPALLSRRLKELEALGLVERMEDRATGKVDYIRTAKAIELEPALDLLARWAQHNVEAEIATREPNISAMMWSARRQIRLAELPQRRVVMRFHFANVASGHDCYWLVAQPGADVDLCVSDPGTDIDLFVETSAVSMAALMLGRSTAAREIAEGQLFLSGDQILLRSVERWFPREDGHDLDGVPQLRLAQAAS